MRGYKGAVERAEGDDVEEIRPFMDSHEQRKSTKYRLGKLPGLPEEAEGNGGQEIEAMQVPERKAKPFKAGDGVTHGLYAHSQPAEAIAAILAENIRGIEEEILGMRLLERGLLERHVQSTNSKEAARLANAYTLASVRLAALIKAEKALAKADDEERQVKELLERAKEQASGGEVRQDAIGAEAGLSMNNRQMTEEIAGARYMLRHTLEQAWLAEETDEFIHTAEIYNQGCMRLLKLLRAEKAGQGQLENEVHEALNDALRRLQEEGFMK